MKTEIKFGKKYRFNKIEQWFDKLLAKENQYPHF